MADQMTLAQKVFTAQIAEQANIGLFRTQREFLESELLAARGMFAARPNKYTYRMVSHAERALARWERLHGG